MIFGHSRSIKSGQVYMSHNTGFTIERLGRLATKAGFAEARVMEGDTYDLWAVLIACEADVLELAQLFAGTKISRLFSSDAAKSGEGGEIAIARSKRVRLMCNRSIGGYMELTSTEREANFYSNQITIHRAVASVKFLARDIQIGALIDGIEVA